jgi:hypothetical protein
MRNLITAFVATVLLPLAAHSQTSAARWQPETRVQPVAAEPFVPGALALDAEVLLDGDGARMPAWLKWGLIGGAGTAALAALLNQASIDVDPPSTGEVAVRGFAIGFVTIGGGVAVWQLVCREGGWSRRNGLCEPGPRRR